MLLPRLNTLQWGEGMNYVIQPGIVRPAIEAGIESPEIASVILTMIVMLHSNENIYRELVDRYNTTGLFPSYKRKFNTLLQSYIIHNCYDEFMRFCRQNSITVFNEDLEVDRKYASSARMIFTVFLREEIQLHVYRVPVREAKRDEKITQTISPVYGHV